MDIISTNKRLIKYLKDFLIFFIVTFIGYIAVSENYFDYVVLTGLPIQNITKLLTFHIIANLGLISGLFLLSYRFITLYLVVKKRGLPFAGFLWIFGALKGFLGLIFFMNVISVWRAYYWIDGTIRVFAALFVIAATIAFFKSARQIATIKTPEEYQELRDEIRRVLDIQEQVIKAKVDDHAK